MACTVDLLAHDTFTNYGTPTIVGVDPLADDDLGTYVDITTAAVSDGHDDATSSIFDGLLVDFVPEVVSVTFNIVATATAGGTPAQPLLMHGDNRYFTGLHPASAGLLLPEGSAVLTQYPITAERLALDGWTLNDLANVLSEPARLVLRGLAGTPGTFRAHRAWLTVTYNCAATSAPWLRQYPRSPLRQWPRERAYQRSNRQAGGYL